MYFWTKLLKFKYADFTYGNSLWKLFSKILQWDIFDLEFHFSLNLNWVLLLQETLHFGKSESIDFKFDNKFSKMPAKNTQIGYFCPNFPIFSLMINAMKNLRQLIPNMAIVFFKVWTYKYLKKTIFDLTLLRNIRFLF